MKIQHLVFLSLLSAADASFTVAAETTDSDQAYALGAREEELMASLDPSELSALLGGKSLAVPHDPAEGLLFYPAEACRLVESQELDDVSKVASAHLFGPSGCGVRPFAGKLLRFSSARSALVRIELRDARGSGSIALWRAGAARPTVGLLDYGPGQSVISTAIVPVCAEVGLDPCSAGEISFAIEGDPVAVTIDLLGYFAPQQKVPTPVAAVAEGGDPVSLSARSLVSPFWEAGVDAGSIHYSDGYVGIGTALPTAPLEVWGLTTSYPNAKAARFIVRGESSTFRDQIAVTSESSAASSTGYGIAFAGSGHHRGGIYARDLGGSASAKGELNLWARSSGNIVLTAGATGINVADPTATLPIVDSRVS